MSSQLKIDFVSDVSCPWCIIGLKALEQAMDRIGDDIDVEMHFQPFELNPDMGTDGQDIVEHIAQKYGSTPEQSAATRKMICDRGAELGFSFNPERWDRIYNTFDTHRLLHWAGLEGRQSELKHALFAAYFQQGENPGAHDVLVNTAESIGLDPERARAILASNEFGNEVRLQETFYQSRGIHAVPAVIVNDKHLIQGGQPPEIFEQALRRIAAGELD